MRLLTHNLLRCNKKGVTNGYPLKIEVEETKEMETEFNPEFVQHMIPKLNWPAMVQAAKEMNAGELPDTLTDELKEDEEFLKLLHHCLMEVTLVKGFLVCPESGRKFPVNNSIPNMLLNEDEV